MSRKHKEHPTVSAVFYFCQETREVGSGTRDLHEIKDVLPGHIRVTHLGEFITLNIISR